MTTMRAIVLTEPGPAENLQLRDVPRPDPQPDWVRVHVRAFGLNRSELHLRLGYAENARFPIVPGIEAAGVVDHDPDGILAPGQQVAAMMGGMGRAFDGGYAEYVVVPRAQLIPFTSDLPWDVIGSVPETLQTAYGSLTLGLDLQPGQTLLVRGGSSALGHAVTALARDLGATVLATTRQPGRLAGLGADHPILDDGNVAARVREIVPGGVHAALELVGTTTLPDTLAATRVHGTVCFAGMLANEWIVKDFYPISYLPTGVRLTSYSGNASDLPAAVLQRTLDRLGDGSLTLGPITTYPLEKIPEAHRDIEANLVSGKVVGLIPEPR
ncbi:alcohol dehydrogenase catalytic domain-containing protein [Actinoplanes sp. HUAS TT8]|uniref:alcohol dehydrogenase catalytic domain-containing protein n=1 Tax=Actinoplanes sp. HUAS TT8 TaxID=3447453 RepID=UPI003F52727E